MTRALAILALPLLAACSGKGKSDDSGPTTPSPCSNLTATANGTVSTAVSFAWDSDEAGTPSVSLDLEGAVTELASAVEGSSHSLTAVGLVAGGEYTWTARVQTAAGELVCEPETVKVSPAPSVVMKFDLNASEPGSAVADGFLVITILQSDSAWSVILDGEGRFRFVHGSDESWYTMAHTRMARDGKSLLWNQFDRDRVLDVGSVARVSLDGTVDTRTRTYLAHHDFAELPDGQSFGWLGYDRRPFAMDIAAAHEDAEAALNCPGGECPIAGEIILEGAEGITQDNEATELVNWWDDWGTDPSWVCDHMWDFSSFVPDYYEWMHANSLVYVDSMDAYFAMSRYTDRIFKVDRAGGTIDWQLGGPDSDFTLTSGEWFDHGHMSEVWDGGFLVFDNGDHRGLTRVSEYAFDETAMTAEVVWTMDHPDGQMLPILGDLKKLPNGNYLVVWSADAVIQEITPAGAVVWELQSSSGGFGVVARADFVEALPTQAE